MARDETARILHPEMALGERFYKVAGLRREGEKDARRDQDDGKAAGEPGGAEPDKRGRYEPAPEARPGLVGAEARRKPWPADRPPGRIGAAIGRPDHGEKPKNGRPPLLRVRAKPQKDHAGHGKP